MVQTIPIALRNSVSKAHTERANPHGAMNDQPIKVLVDSYLLDWHSNCT